MELSWDPACKCHLFEREVRYHERIVSQSGHRIDPESTKAVISLRSSQPKTIGEARKLTGLLSYYRRGAALYQMQDGKFRVIAFVSRTLTATERNFHLHSSKLEFLALKWAITEQSQAQRKDRAIGKVIEYKQRDKPPNTTRQGESTARPSIPLAWIQETSHWRRWNLPSH